MMSERQYSYKKDWDDIYRIPGDKPWEKTGIPPYLKTLFDDPYYRNNHTKANILDVGCGKGDLCEYLSDLGYEKVTGVDVSKVILDQCRKPSKVDYEWMDVVNGDFSTHKKYDIVICWFLLHHIKPEHIEKLVINLFNLCESNGMLILSFLLPGKDRKSFFSDDHNVSLYPVERVVNDFSPYFRIIRTAEEDKNLLDRPDEHQERYHYHVLRMKKDVKEELSGKILEFKNKYILPDSSVYRREATVSESFRELIKLLNTFSRFTKDGGKLSEEDFAERFKSLFRNVSRYICRRINDLNQNEKVVILKMDTPHTTLYSATRMAANGRAHCKMNQDENPEVRSRAYELFYKYSAFLGQSSLDENQHYTIHKHFSDHPDLEFIGFWWDRSLKREMWPDKAIDLKDFPNYNCFLKSLFLSVGPHQYNQTDVFSDFYHYINYYGVENTELARSFSAFNLSIPGFESWGTLMVEGIEAGFDEIRDLFYRYIGRQYDETALLREIKNILFILKKIDYDYYGALATRRIVLQSVKSAIAQVMARNLSHNYGSHVLNHLVNPREDTFKFNGAPYHCKTLSTDDKLKDTFQQIVFFNNHIKCRVDYISDVSYGAPLVQTTRNVYGDIFRELDRVSLLMNHISGLENQFEYEIALYGTNGERLDKVNDITIAVPNDVVGTHAFYNILENVIRNTAKHSKIKAKRRRNGPVVFNIVFSDVQIKDVFSKEMRDEAEQYYCVEIYDNVSMDAKSVESLVEVQNMRLKEPVFENDRPRSHSLGLVEMLASAAYLRKLDSMIIDEDNSDQLNLMEAIMKPSDVEGEYFFGYRFYVLRPQEVLFVGDGLETLHNPKEGVWAVNSETFRRGIMGGRVYNHEFVVYEKSNNEIGDIIGKNRMALSPRILTINKDDVLFKDCESMTRLCWECWNEVNEKAKKWEIRYFSHSKETECNSETAVYKHHLKSEDDKKDFKDEDSKENEAVYAEAMSSVALDKLPQISLIAVDQENRDVQYCNALLEAGVEVASPFRCIYVKNREAVNNRILVIDERIQDAAERYSYGSGDCVLPFSTFYDKMRVTVPRENDINLSEKDFRKVAAKIKNYIKNQVRNFDYDYVLIHYGILERIFKPESETNWEHNMEAYLNGLMAMGNVPRIVLTSGRGVPRSMPHGVGFVSLSSVTMALIDYKSKYLFSRLMYAARCSTK